MWAEAMKYFGSSRCEIFGCIFLFLFVLCYIKYFYIWFACLPMTMNLLLVINMIHRRHVRFTPTFFYIYFKYYFYKILIFVTFTSDNKMCIRFLYLLEVVNWITISCYMYGINIISHCKQLLKVSYIKTHLSLGDNKKVGLHFIFFNLQYIC